MSPLSLEAFRKLVEHAENNGILSLFNQDMQDNYYRPDGDEDTNTIEVATFDDEDEADTKEFPSVMPDDLIVVITFVAHGAEGERTHPAPCGYPEYLCSCHLNESDAQ